MGAAQWVSVSKNAIVDAERNHTMAFRRDSHTIFC